MVKEQKFLCPFARKVRKFHRIFRIQKKKFVPNFHERAIFCRRRPSLNGRIIRFPIPTSVARRAQEPENWPRNTSAHPFYVVTLSEWEGDMLIFAFIIFIQSRNLYFLF